MYSSNYYLSRYYVSGYYGRQLSSSLEITIPKGKITLSGLTPLVGIIDECLAVSEILYFTTLTCLHAEAILTPLNYTSNNCPLMFVTEDDGTILYTTERGAYE